MQRYRMRPQVLDAIQFDGTDAGVERVVAFMRQAAPGIPVRPRIEYRGWDDLVGYRELEVFGLEHGCMAGDWLVISDVDGTKTPWMLDGRTFEQYYEAVPSEDGDRALPKSRSRD